jgi:hypothetical protein
VTSSWHHYDVNKLARQKKHARLAVGAFMHMHAVRRELKELRAHVGCGSDQDQAAEIHCRLWAHRRNMMKSLGTSYSCGKSIGGWRRQRSYRGAYLGPRRFDDGVQLVGGRRCFLANGRWRSADVGRGEKYNLLHQRFPKLGTPLAVVLVCFAQGVATYIYGEKLSTSMSTSDIVLINVAPSTSANRPK